MFLFISKEVLDGGPPLIIFQQTVMPGGSKRSYLNTYLNKPAAKNCVFLSSYDLLLSPSIKGLILETKILD